MNSDEYTMTISLNVLNHLGINLYSNIPAVLSEVVANSWDADAANVSVSIDSADKTITIIDDGCGMTSEEVNDRYLSVGYAKRLDSAKSPIFGRKYMGRKGIGKLSMFSIAKTVDVITKKDGVVSSFRMDIDEIEKTIQNGNSSYHPKSLGISEDEDLINDGTKIVLSNLKKSISSATPEFLRKRIARRFSIIGEKFNFSVIVNNKGVSVEDRAYYSHLQYIWYYGEEGAAVAENANKVQKKIQRENTVYDKESGKEKYAVSGWLGTVDNAGALKDGDENLNKIVIIVRGKVGQEDILGEFSEGGLYSKYLIGEIHADFLDDDEKEDIATSSRQDYKKDDSRYEALKDFIYGELKNIQKDWTEFRNDAGLEQAKEIDPRIQEWFDGLPVDEKRTAKKLLGKVNQIIVDDDKRKEVLRYGILAFEKLRYNQQLSKLDSLDANNLEALGSVITGFDEIEATLYYQIVKERIGIIKYFQTLVDDNEKEKAIQKYLFDHLWLLDPSWERAHKTEFMEKTVFNALGIHSDKLTSDERLGRLDIGYREVTGKHIIVELKRAGRSVTTSELVDQVMKYSNAITKVLRDANLSTDHEIIIVLGKPVDGDSSAEHRAQVSKTLDPSNGRVVYYTELINNAYKAYSEYLDISTKTKALLDILDALADNEIVS